MLRRVSFAWWNHEIELLHSRFLLMRRTCRSFNGDEGNRQALRKLASYTFSCDCSLFVCDLTWHSVILSSLIPSFWREILLGHGSAKYGWMSAPASQRKDLRPDEDVFYARLCSYQRCLDHDGIAVASLGESVGDIWPSENLRQNGYMKRLPYSLTTS